MQVSAQTKIDSNTVEEIVVFTTRGINASGARYHLDGCRYLKNGQIHIDERIALQRGLLPCSVCLPERTSDLPQLREKKVVQKKVVFRKCGFKTASSGECEREAIPDSRYYGATQDAHQEKRNAKNSHKEKSPRISPRAFLIVGASGRDSNSRPQA